MSEYAKQILESGGSYEDLVPIDFDTYPILMAELLKQGPPEYFPTGFSSLDNIIKGFQQQRLYVLSAPTKQGKTTYAQSMMYEMAKTGRPSLFFSYEMGWQEVTRKFADMDTDMKKSGTPTNLPIYIPKDLHRGGSKLQYDWLFEAIAKAKLENNVDFVVIDHLHFLIPLRDYKNMSILVGNVVRELKRIAVITNTAIILISHIRKIQHDDIPTYEDLRDSSLIAQEADMVLMMHRVKNKQAPKKATEGSVTETFTDQAILSVEINRDGGYTGRIKLKHKNGRFFEWTDQDEQEFLLNKFVESEGTQKALRARSR